MWSDRALSSVLIILCGTKICTIVGTGVHSSPNDQDSVTPQRQAQIGTRQDLAVRIIKP